MTTTLGLLVDAHDALNAILALPLNAATAWKLSKLAMEVRPQTDSYAQQRSTAILRLGAPDPQRDGFFKFDAENGAAFDAEMDALRAIAVEITSPLISLKSLNGQQVSGATLMALGPLLIDDADAV